MKQTNIYKKYISTIWFACVMIFFSQPILAQDITLQLKNVTVKEAIEALHKTKNYSVVIKSAEINMSKKVSVNATNAPIKAVLVQIFVGQNVSYAINGYSIIISKKSDTSQQNSSKRKKQTITGIVYDEEGNPVIGASVMNKETAQGAITDLDGKFSLEAFIPSTIEISYVGYEMATVNVKDNQTKTIRLIPSSLMIDEVVVVGYGSQRRSNLTGAVSTISSKDLNNRPVVSAANALQGADPSVNLTFGTGSPESGYSLNIRGGISVNGGTPLVLCDGVEVPLNQVNANDIESISVLKDASSCAIYGAKASAGVVLITTKSGSAATKGKAKISYNGRFGWTQNTTSTDFIRTGYDYVTFANKFYHAYNGVNMYLYEDEELQKLYDRRNDMTENPERPWVEIGEDGKYYYYGNTDWYGHFYNRTRPQMEHNVSITGGGEKVNYYISGRYYQQYGMFNIDKDLYKDYSFRAKMDAQLNKWIKWSTNIGLDNNNYRYNGTSNYAMTIARLESNISPSFVPFNPDGTIVQYTNQLYANSPLGAGDGGYLTSQRGHNTKSRTLLSVVNQIDITLLEGLTLTANYSYQQRKQLYRYRNNSFEYSRSQGVTQTFTSGSIFNNYEEDESFPVTHMLNYYATFEHSWAKKHNLKVVAGSQYETYRNVNKDTSMTNLSNDNLDSFSAVTPESVLTVSQDISAYKTLGFFGRINYDYMGKYLLEVSCRADGSSRFAEGDRWGIFPSVSAGWRISEENFFKPVSDWWSSLKLRASVGSLGNQQVDYYAYLQTITSDNQFSYTFDGEGKAYYAKISNPISSGLTWETVATYNVGLDMSFLRNRLSMSADYYVRKTTDMLTTSLTLPDVYGASTPKANCADLRTNGWELSVSWNDSFKVANKPFRYGIQATLGDYQRTITKYNNPDKLISDHYVGKKMGEIWGYHVDGLFKTDKEAAEYQAKINDKAVNGRVYSSKVDGYLRAGDVRFADLNGDNVIGAGAGTVDDPGDKRIIGNTTPRYNYSFRLDASWNGFDVSAFFQGIGKRDWYPSSSSSSQGANSFWGPYSFPSTSFIEKSFPEDCWTEDNRNAFFPRIRGYQSYSGGSLGTVNDRYIQNIAYLRFKNLSIGYTLPINKRFFEKVRVYVSGENLYYWSPLKKHNKTIDPELAISSSTYSSNTGSGYAYPRVYTVGVDITF